MLVTGGVNVERFAQDWLKITGEPAELVDGFPDLLRRGETAP